MNFIQRFVARRKLKAVVDVMPMALQRMFGARDEYSFGQVARVLEKIKAPHAAAPYAFAAFCAPAEFARPEISELSRDALRAELSKLFHLDADFTPSELRSRLRGSNTGAGYDNTNGNSDPMNMNRD